LWHRRDWSDVCLSALDSSEPLGGPSSRRARKPHLEGFVAHCKQVRKRMHNISLVTCSLCCCACIVCSCPQLQLVSFYILSRTVPPLSGTGYVRLGYDTITYGGNNTRHYQTTRCHSNEWPMFRSHFPATPMEVPDCTASHASVTAV
jgi:hypothetical protein